MTIDRTRPGQMARACAQLLGWLVLLLAAGAGSVVSAQSTGTMVGVVTDPSGAAIPNARVKLVQAGTEFTRLADTNASGRYVGAQLPTGEYSVAATAPGFEQLEKTGIRLTAASTVSVHFQLTVGSETQSIKVTAAAPLLQSETAAVSALVDNRQIVSLPLVARDFTDLVLLTPGAHLGSATNTALGGGPYAMRSGANYSINGSVPQGNSYLIDGIYNRSLWLNGPVMVPVVDAVEEYRVMTSTYNAEYGQSAGAVTEVNTRSGSNRLVGTAWEFLRNDRLNANSFFNNQGGVRRPSFRRNEFGFTLGGPVVRDKTFFFVDYQGIRLNQPTTFTSIIPMRSLRQAALGGDFSGLGTTIYDPYSLRTSASGTSAKTAFPGNQVPLSSLDSAALKFVLLLPDPNSTAATNNYTINPALTQRTDQFDARMDQNTGASDRLFVRYGYDNSLQVWPGSMLAPANSDIPIGPYVSTAGRAIRTPLVNQSATVGYTKVLSPATVAAAHFGVVRWNIHLNPLGIGFKTATALGIPGININELSGGVPGFTVSGYTSLGDTSTFPETSQITTFQFDGALSMTRGSHTVKTGLLFLRHRLNGYSSYPARGTFDFNGQFASQVGAVSSKAALADFLLGVPNSGNRSVLQGPFGMRLWTVAPYAQDTWRATPRLTLEFGLRWEVDAPPYEVHDRWSNLNVATGLVELAGESGNGRRLRTFDLRTLAPRAGLIYALTEDRKTILRSGAGISYVSEAYTGAQLYKNSPYYLTQTITSDISGAPPTTLSAGLPVPVMPSLTDLAALSSGSFNASDHDLRMSEIIQWNFGLQRELRPDWMLELNYVGTRGMRLIRPANLNQSVPGSGAQGPRMPYYSRNPNLSTFSYWTNFGDSKYHSLQAHIEKRFSRGLMFAAVYTYAKFLSDVGNPNGGGNLSVQDYTCWACNYGPTPDDYTHVLSINHQWELPFGPGREFLRSGAWSKIAGNWDFNGIWSANTGGTVTPAYSVNVSNSTGGDGQRPNRIADGNLPASQRTINRWFDTSAFAAPAQYTFGNAGTGILRGPGMFNADLSVVRRFRLSESVSLDYRAEWFNTFNHPNFGSPNATIGTSSAGVVSSTGPARIIQMAVKLLF
jgi:hypothetical protein